MHFCECLLISKIILYPVLRKLVCVNFHNRFSLVIMVGWPQPVGFVQIFTAVFHGLSGYRARSGSGVYRLLSVFTNSS